MSLTMWLQAVLLVAQLVVWWRTRRWVKKGEFLRRQADAQLTEWRI